MCENQNFEQWVLGIFRFFDKRERIENSPIHGRPICNMPFNSVKEKKGKEIELIKPFLKHASHKAHFTDF